jgi:MFS family permease
MPQTHPETGGSRSNRRGLMEHGGAAVVQLGGLRAISRYQWLVFFVVWLGWTLDAADFGLYALVLRPALTELLGGNPSMAQIGTVGGFLSMAGLLGWAVGGFLFGIIADYIGRVRALMFSIVIYSVFTALQGVSQGIWDFAIYRFIAGIGTGAELMVGIPLLAEAMGETHRAKIAGFMMSGGALGTFLGAGPMVSSAAMAGVWSFLSAWYRRSSWRSSAAAWSSRITSLR